MARGKLTALVLVALLAASCGGGGDAADAAPEEGGAAGSGRPSDVEPLDVVLALDEASTGRATIGPEGGVLDVTGTDGTAFHLELPAGAVAEPTEITLTPVTGMDPQPLSGGLHGGAQLGPDGLRLGDLATLTIRPAEPLDPTAAVGLGWSGAGEGLGLIGIGGTPEAVELTLAHFSGAAVGEGTEEDRGRVRDQAAAVCAYWYESGMRMAVDPTRQLTEDDATGADLEYIAQMLRGWFDECVEPQLVAGKETDQALAVGISELVLWRFNAMVWADGDRGVAERDATGQRLAQEGLVAALERATDDCAAKHDLTAVERMVRWTEVAQLHGFDEGESAFDGEALDARITDCLTFELQWKGKMDFRFEGFEPAVEHVSGSVVVKPTVSEMARTGRIELGGAGPVGITQTGYDRFISEFGELFFQGLGLAGEALTGVDVPDDLVTPDLDRQQIYGCRVSDPGPSAATPTITGLTLSVGPAPAVDATIPVAAGSGMPVSCDQPVGSFDVPPFYFSMLAELHPDLVQGDALRLSGWQVGSGATWATRTFAGAIAEDGVSISQETTLTLVHAAGRAATSAPGGGGGSAFAPLE